MPQAYRGRVMVVQERVEKNGRPKVVLRVVRLDGSIGELGGAYLLSTWHKWHEVIPEVKTTEKRFRSLRNPSGSQGHRWPRGVRAPVNAAWKRAAKKAVKKVYPKPTSKELCEENRQISEASDRFHAEMKDAKVLDVPMTPLVGMAVLALGLFLPPGSPERRRAMSGAVSLFTRHTLSHLAEGGKMAEGFPETPEGEKSGGASLFETMFKKRDQSAPIPQGGHDKPK